MRRPAVIGNWKMNGDLDFTKSLVSALTEEWSGVHETDVAICPPFPYLSIAADLLENSNIGLGSQDISVSENGAYTGDVSGSMLADLGCKYVLVGHSERREYHNESSALVAKKFKAALDKQLVPVLCVGESLEQREAGDTVKVVSAQVKAVIDYCGAAQLGRGVIAYEPIWAIGTGKSATPEMAQEVHAAIRELLGSEAETMKILYGGSVKPETAAALFAQKDIDGALVGGASLKAQDFLAICRAAE